MLIYFNYKSYIETNIKNQPDYIKIGPISILRLDFSTILSNCFNV